jgi:outer membrane protein assembly factor BamB
MNRAFHSWLLSVFVGSCYVAFGTGHPALAENWPQWRGPRHDGTSRETNLPVTWSKSKGVAWRCPLPEWGDSTPAIWNESIFVTTHVDNEKLLLLKISKPTGQIQWTRQVGTGVTPNMALQGKNGEQRRQQWFHESHNYASPSPATDGEVVVVHFGNGDLAAYDFDGTRLWHHNLQKDYGNYTIWWGHANSPVLYDDLVISVCMQDSCADLPGEPSPSYVVAHDKRTGRQRWKTMRPTAASHESCDSYTTPILWHNGDRMNLVVMGGQILDAYDPKSGERLWYLSELIGNRTITGPVATEKMIYVTQGMRQPLLAVHPGGEGKRPKEDVVWRSDRNTPDSPTPVVCGQLLFLVTNDGTARCLDATTGKQQWKQRLKGNYRASPLAADQHVYFLNTEGITTVVAASSTFEQLAENQLEEETLASPIASDGRMYIRGRKALHCLTQ